MSFAEMEGISEAEYISHYFTGFCLCCFIYLFIYFTSQLTDSYDLQMGEQERV